MKPYTLNKAWAELENSAKKLIYMRFDRSNLIFDWSNLMQIYFSAEFPIQPKSIWRVGFYVLLQV